MDAGDVQEVILVVVGEQPLHLGGVHTAVGLGHVDNRQVEVGEDVDLGAVQDQGTAADDGDDHHHDRNRVPQREDNGVHLAGSFNGGGDTRTRTGTAMTAV